MSIGCIPIETRVTIRKINGVSVKLNKLPYLQWPKMIANLEEVHQFSKSKDGSNSIYSFTDQSWVILIPQFTWQVGFAILENIIFGPAPASKRHQEQAQHHIIIAATTWTQYQEQAQHYIIIAATSQHNVRNKPSTTLS